jgi:DNA-binding HxlR family transcriptional regulator
VAVMDTMEVLEGKWRIPILAVISQEPRGFKEIIDEVGISPKILSAELSFLEGSNIITRKLKKTDSKRYFYRLTEYGLTLNRVIGEMKNWGLNHRRKFISSDL